MDDILRALLAALDPPGAFAESPSPLWNDEHISKQMLAAHLDPEFDGASRGPAFMDASAAFIAAQLPLGKYPRLCDYGCGPGLYLERLAPLGYACTGVDFSPRSIAFATARAAAEGLDIAYRVHNYLHPLGSGPFDAALLIYCDYGALPPAGRAALLGNIHASLAPGGRLLLDVFTPAALDAFAEEQSWRALPKGGFWSAEPHLALQRNVRYPHRLSLQQTAVLAGGTVRGYYIWAQHFTVEQLEAEARSAGFKVASIFDDVTGTPHTGGALTLAVLLQKAD